MSEALMREVVFSDLPPATAEFGPLLENNEDDLFLPLMRSSDAPAPQEKLRRGLNYSHDAMVDAIVADPGITQNELAAMFGYTPSWISQVINSDVFKARLAARSAELRDPIIIATMDEQFRGILARGLELTRKKLEQENVSDSLLIRSMDLSARALGYGAKSPESGRNPNVEEKLADLSNNLVHLLHQQKRAAITIDGETE